MIGKWVLTLLALACFVLAAIGKQRFLGDSEGGGWRVLLINGKTDILPDPAWRLAYGIVGVGLLMAAVIV